jgi:hypothetical protein
MAFVSRGIPVDACGPCNVERSVVVFSFILGFIFVTLLYPMPKILAQGHVLAELGRVCCQLKWMKLSV